MAITLPRERKSAAYRSTSASGLIGLTRSSSAGNFLAFGEDVPPPYSAPFALPVFGRRYHTPSRPRNKSLRRGFLNVVRPGPKKANRCSDGEPLLTESEWVWALVERRCVRIH